MSSLKTCFDENIPETFSKYFIKAKWQHQHKAPSSSKNDAEVQEVNTKAYGNDSIKYQSKKIWKSLQKELKNNDQSQPRQKRQHLSNF